MGDPAASVTIDRSMAPAVVAGVLASVALVVAPGVPVAAAAATALLVPAAAIDVREQRLPDPLLLAAAGVLVTAMALGVVAGGGADPIGMLVGAAAMAIPLLLVHLASPAAMGFGDVKLAVVLGAATGSATLALVALALGTGCSAVVGVALRRRTVPLGPGLVGGAVITLVVAALAGRAETIAVALDPIGGLVS